MAFLAALTLCLAFLSRLLAFVLALGVLAFLTAFSAFLSFTSAALTFVLALSTAALALVHSSLAAGEALVRAVQLTVPLSQEKDGNVLILKLPLACWTPGKEPLSVVVPLELLKAWLTIGKGWVKVIVLPEKLHILPATGPPIAKLVKPDPSAVRVKLTVPPPACVPV